MSQYSRVPQQESTTGSNTATNNNNNNNHHRTDANFTRSRGERLQDKLIALAWVVVAIAVGRWTSFLETLWQSPDLNRTLLRIAGFGTLTVLSLILYLTVYLPKVKGLADSSAWGVYCPRVLPIMAGVGVVTYLVFLRATWPVWGFWAPLISGTQFMGTLMALHFIPSIGIC